MSDCSIRPLAAGDLDDVIGIWLEGNKQAHPFVDASYWEGNAAAVREALPQADVFVCERAGEVLGFIGLSGHHIEGLFVRNSARSQGVGTRLLDLAKSRQDRLTLCVYAQNERAAKFYLREGFAVAQTRIDEATGHEEYLMEWRK